MTTRLLRFLIVVWLCLAGHAGAQSGSYIPVYDNGLPATMMYYTWVGEVPIGVDLAAAAPGKSGSALELNFANNLWNSFVFHVRNPEQPELPDYVHNHYFLNEVRTLEFDLYIEPDAVGMDHLTVIFDQSGTIDPARVIDYIPNWSGMTDAERLGRWHHISIDIAALHPTFQVFNRIIFNDSPNGSAGDPHLHFRLYDVKLGKLPDTTPPAITLKSAGHNVTYSAVTLNFSTDELATYAVTYGVGALDRQANEVDQYNNVLWNTEHTVTLAGFNPGDTVQYRIVALDHRMDPGASSNQGVFTGSYTLPARPTEAPVISGFAAASVGAHTATLVWNTNRATSAVVTYQKRDGNTSSRTLADTQASRSFIIDMLAPDSAYAVTLTVQDVFGMQAAQTLVLQTPASGTAGSAGALTASIDATARRPISPYIYGTNQYYDDNWYTFGRMGGDYMPTFNWTANAYNSGFWNGSENGTWFLQRLGVPRAQFGVAGEAVRRDLNKMMRGKNSSVEAALLTVQLLGHVAADHGPPGDVTNSGADYLQTRFKPIRMFKNAPFSLMPDPDEPYVYMDEFVNWVTKVAKPSFPGKKFFYSMDNEPEIWSGTHPRLKTSLNSYDDICQKNEEGAKAVKSVDPQGLVFGLVSYGFYGWAYMQGGPDGNNGDHTAKGDFTDYYLKWMKAAEQRAGKRLIDVLDLHVYATAVTPDNRGVITDDTDPVAVATRVQAPRQLWDPTYVEDGFWATPYLDGNHDMSVLRRMQKKIDDHYPGTKIAITEYNYGGGKHISGAVAQADALGIYGQYGLFAANLWQMNLDESFIRGAFRMFRGFDGGKANFGDISLFTTSSDVAKVAVYASLDSTAPAPGRVVIVAINRDTGYQNVGIQGIPLPRGTVKAYRMEGTSPNPYFLGEQTLDSATLAVNLPPMSITTFDIH